MSKSDEKLVIPEISSPPMHDNAYVWLLMKGDSYLPGVFTSIYSVLRTDPDADLVVMITEDVSQSTRTLLLKVATHLFMVPYLSFKSKPMKTETQRKYYESWINTSFTKWNMLAVPYRKALFVDGDTIHTCNTDDLFKIKAPAAPWSSPYAKPLGRIFDQFKGKRGSDGYALHETELPIKAFTDTFQKGGIIFTANSILLEPNLNDYAKYIAMLKSMEPFGFPPCHSGPDEQSIAYFYIHVKKVPWTNIHHRYNYVSWKDGYLSKGDVPKIIHYISPNKPWTMKYNEYPDVIDWYKMASAAIKATGVTADDIKIKQEDVASADKADDVFIKKFINVNNVLDIAERLS